MFIVLIPDYHAIGEYYKWMYVIVIALLVAVYLFGTEVSGTKGWFRIGNSGFQPAELGKIVMIIAIARMIANCTRGKDGGIRKIRDILPVAAVFALPVLLIMIQPDWGRRLCTRLLFSSCCYSQGTSIKLIIGLLVCTGVALPAAWLIMAPAEDTFTLFLGSRLKR